jgi:hypothetical protein
LDISIQPVEDVKTVSAVVEEVVRSKATAHSHTAYFISPTAVEIDRIE